MLCGCTIAAVLLADLILVVTVATPLQEVSFRWMGLAGIALPLALGLAVVATVAATLLTWAAPAGARRHVAVAAALVLPWSLVLVLSAPTLSGMLAPRPAGDGAPLVLLSQNLWYRNPDPAATARRVLERDADVLVLVEYTPAHAAALRDAGVRERYPYRWEEEGDLGGGLAVMSRLPFDDVRRIPTWSGAVAMTLATDGGPVRLVAVHPVAPSDYWGLQSWKRDYRTLTAELRDAPASTVVAGDFNATGAHRRFRALLATGRLADAQDLSGSGFGATWPGTRWVPPVMRLDHVLVGSAIGAARVELIDDPDTDHRGVEAHLRVPGDDAAVG